MPVVGGRFDLFGYVIAMAEVICKLGSNLKIHIFTTDAIQTEAANHFVIHPIGFGLDHIASEVDVAFFNCEYFKFRISCSRTSS